MTHFETAGSRWRRRVVLGSVAVAATVALGLAGCSSTGESAGDSTQSIEGSGTLDGNGQKIVVFMPSTSNVYLKFAADAIRSEGQELGYDVTVIENNWDQNEQDQQVQQWISSGEEAAAILWWPSTAEAGVNSSRLLAQEAPVFQFNQGIPAGGEEFITAYAGVSDAGIGQTAGESALEALEIAIPDGMKFHGPDGKPNLIEIAFPSGYQAAIDRQASFMDVAGDQFNVLATEHAAVPDAQSGFEAASQIIPKFKSEGIDFVYAHSNNVAVGVIRALEQNGLVPGKDVIVIAGDYSGDKQPLRDGKIYSAVVQSPVIEGMLVMRVVAQYLATGELNDDSVVAEAGDVKPELKIENPAKTTIMPNPPVTAANYDSFKIWGMGIDELVK